MSSHIFYSEKPLSEFFLDLSHSAFESKESGVKNFINRNIISRVELAVLSVFSLIEAIARSICTLAGYCIQAISLGYAGVILPSLQFSSLAMQASKIKRCFLNVFYGVCGSLSPHLIFKSASPPPSASTDTTAATQPKKVRARLILGSINQYDGEGDRSSCTCNAVNFLAEIFSLTTPSKDITKEFIDRVVSTGKRLFDEKILPARAQGIREIYEQILAENDEESAKEFIERQGGSHTSPTDVLSVFPDRFEDSPAPLSPPLHALPESSTARVQHFKDILKELKEKYLLQGGRKAAGSVITCNHMTFSVAVVKTPSSIEYAIFDSHGNNNLNRSSKAFVYITKDMNLAARYLEQLIPYYTTEIPKDLEDLTDSQKKAYLEEMAQMDANLVGHFFLVTPRATSASV